MKKNKHLAQELKFLFAVLLVVATVGVGLAFWLHELVLTVPTVNGKEYQNISLAVKEVTGQSVIGED